MNPALPLSTDPLFRDRANLRSTLILSHTELAERDYQHKSKMARKMKGKGIKTGKKEKAGKNRAVSYPKFLRALEDGKLTVIKTQLQNGADVNREFKAETDS